LAQSSVKWYVEFETPMKNPLAKITGLSTQPWMKMPYGTISLLKKCGYSSSEVLVVLFFYMKLDISPIDESTVVFTTSQEVMDFCGVTRRVLYRALETMISKGLVKTAPHTYDMKDFLERMDKRGENYIVQGNT
jgi:DNA-binding MarR family transcriptional regulator